MRAFTFICFAAAAPKCWALDQGSNHPRRLSTNITNIWEQHKVTASDAATGDSFGYSVAIDGDTVVIGAYSAGTGGAVYVLRTSDGGATYALVAKLTASDGAAGDSFGISVAIDGDTIVVGASGDDDASSCTDGGCNSGSAYVFRTSDGGATYNEVAKLTASDAASGDLFGISVAIDGDTMVIGASQCCNGNGGSGVAYVFRTTDGGATYGQVAKLIASDAAADDQFGFSVAIDGSTIVIGTQYGNAAYVFRTNDGGATYDEVAKLTASDAASYDYFGVSVAIDGSTVVVGAYGGEAAYVFRTSDGGATYNEVAKLTASDAASGVLFGYSVAIDGDTVVIGAHKYDDSGPGAAYAFRTTDGGATYGQVTKLTAADGSAGDYFGISVAIDGATVVVGAYGDDDSGSAYVFSLPALDENSALGSDSATRAGGTLATALLAFAATALAL